MDTTSITGGTISIATRGGTTTGDITARGITTTVGRTRTTGTIPVIATPPYPAYAYAAPAPGVHIVVPNIYIPLR